MSDHPTDADKLIEQLDDPDPYERSVAALALHRMGHPAALEACLRTLNDGEDFLHLDYTPSVLSLSEMGRPALIPLLDFLLDDDDLTRLRAQRAVEGITTRMFGFDGDRWPKKQRRAWRKWWQAIDYDSEDDPDARQAAVSLLRDWAEGNG